MKTKTDIAEVTWADSGYSRLHVASTTVWWFCVASVRWPARWVFHPPAADTLFPEIDREVWVWREPKGWHWEWCVFDVIYGETRHSGTADEEGLAMAAALRQAGFWKGGF